MSLTITIGRTEGGTYRAEVAEDSRLVIEHADLSALVAELKRNLDLLAVTPDGKLLLGSFKPGDDQGDAAARAEVEKTALRNEELDELIEKYPVPTEWGDEPGWSDAH